MLASDKADILDRYLRHLLIKMMNTEEQIGLLGNNKLLNYN